MRPLSLCSELPTFPSFDSCFDPQNEFVGPRKCQKPFSHEKWWLTGHSGVDLASRTKFLDLLKKNAGILLEKRDLRNSIIARFDPITTSYVLESVKNVFLIEKRCPPGNFEVDLASRTEFSDFSYKNC